MAEKNVKQANVIRCAVFLNIPESSQIARAISHSTVKIRKYRLLQMLLFARGSVRSWWAFIAAAARRSRAIAFNNMLFSFIILQNPNKLFVRDFFLVCH